MRRFVRRLIGPQGNRRTGRLVLAPILVAALVALLSVGAARAVHDLGLFELDNNTVNDGGAGDDWNQVFADEQAGACDTIGIACAFVTDPANETIFIEGGSKDDLDIPQWRHTTGSVPDKDELTNAYAALYTTGGSSPQAILYFGADRFAQNGSANLGFWFFKSPVSVNADGTFSGVHSVGDLLVLSEFTNGGGVSTIKAFEWLGSGGDTNGTLQSVDLGGASADCDAIPPGTAHTACATVNGQAIQPAWPYTPKSGPSGTIPSGGFFEGGVNLSALGLAGCFSSFLAETRSSPSVDAVLKDFVTGTFAPCSARISIRPSEDTNEVDDTHELTVRVQKEDPSTGFSLGPAVGVDVTGAITSGPGSFVDGDNTCTTDANGECTLTVTSALPGVTTVSASASVTLSEGTALDVSTDGVAPNSGPATKRWVDGRISVSPLVDTNEITDDHTVTATVEQDDGLPATTGDGVDGFAPLSGATVTFSLLNNTAGAVFVPAGTNTCVTGVDGQCSIQITSDTTGSVDIRATSTFSVDGVSLTRTTGTGAPNSADANKRFVSGRISINPPTDMNGITENHTLTATVEEDDGAAPDGFDPVSAATVTFTLLNNTAGAVFVGGVSTCTTGADGQCSIQITSSTAGSVDIQASSTWVLDGVTLTRTTGTGAPNGGNANKVFVDGTLRWLKHDQDGNLLGGATFEVCRTHDFNSATGEFDDISPDVCVTVQDDSAPDADPDAGELQLEDLVLGRYRITETAPPPGYAGDPNSQTVELTVAKPSNTTSPPVFINEQLFKVIVITCNDSVDPEELVDSTVTLNGEQKETITDVPGHLGLQGVTEADLCAIGGASYGDLPADPNLGATIELPDVAPLFPPTP